MHLPRRQLILGATSLALLPRAAQSAETRIPFTLLNGKMFVELEVNGQRAQAMVDSGSQLSAVSRAFAAAHGIPLGRRMAFRGIQGVAAAHRVDGVVLRLPGVAFTGDLVALDLAGMAEAVQHEIDAVVGGDLFRAYVVDIDFDAMTLAFYDRATFAPPPGARIVPLQPVRELMTLTLDIEGAAPIQALVDLGNNTPLIVSPGPARQAGLLDGRRSSTRIMGGHGSQGRARVTTARSIRFADERFSDVPVMIPPRPIGFDANLGLPVLWRFRLYLDYGGRRLWLGAPTGDRNEPFQRDYVGLETRLDGPNLKVVSISPGSPAQAAGFRTGEVITAINGEAVQAVNAGLSLTEKPGARLKLTLSTGEVRTLTLATYY